MYRTSKNTGGKEIMTKWERITLNHGTFERIIRLQYEWQLESHKEMSLNSVLGLLLKRCKNT